MTRAEGINGLKLSKEAKLLRREIHSVLKQVDYDYQRMQYNTVVSGAMKRINALEDFKTPDDDGGLAVVLEGFSILLRTLYPATPHIAHTLWSELGFAESTGDLLDAPWSVVDPAALAQDEIELMLQVNGKLRGSLTVPSNAFKEEIEALTLVSPSFVQFAAGAPIKRIIIVPGRLVNVVL